MTSAERQRVTLHANLITQLVGAMPTIRGGLTIITVPDQGGTTWIAADFEDEPTVKALMFRAGTYYPPVPLEEDVRDEMLEFVQSRRAGTLSAPTKENA